MNNTIDRQEPFHPHKTILISMQILLANDARVERTAGRTREAASSLEWLILGLLVLAALAIRFVHLGTFPDTFLADEADNAQDAVRILYGRTPVNGLFGVDWTSQPAFSIYKQAAFIAVFGFNITALRLPSALIGAIALIPFYILLRRQFPVIASVLATVLLGTSVWYLNFSRSGWNIVDICFDMLMAMLFLLWALDAVRSPGAPRRAAWMYFAAAGFFCALALYGYPSGRAVSVAVAAFLPLALLSQRQNARDILLGYALLFAVEALVFAPQALYAIRNWDYFNGRSNVVFLLNKPEYQADPAGTLLNQLERNLRGPWDGRVNNTPQYSPAGEPQLDRLSGALVLAGMLLTLFVAACRKRPETWLWCLMLFSMWFFTQILTVNTPNGARGLGYVPALYYFAAAGLDGLVRLGTYGLRRLSIPPSRAGAARGMAGLLLVAIVSFGGYANVKHYADWQNDPQTRQARYLYVTAREFPEWSAAIQELARTNRNILNVGQWRAAHPIADIAHP